MDTFRHDRGGIGMMMRAGGLVIAGLLLSPPVALAGDAGERSCPVRYKLNSLCSEIQSRSEAAIPVRKNPYNYYKSILEASCVTDSDSTDAMNAKVSAMWDQLEREGGLTCTNTLFAIPGGSVIKFGVAMNFDRFIHDVTRWGVNLNRMDPSDGRTVLDYVRDERQKYAGGPLDARLGVYYDKLRKAGAKHASEL